MVHLNRQYRINTGKILEIYSRYTGKTLGKYSYRGTIVVYCRNTGDIQVKHRGNTGGIQCKYRVIQAKYRRNTGDIQDKSKGNRRERKGKYMGNKYKRK